METIELSTPDRARMDLLLVQLERWNDTNNSDVLISCTEAARLLQKSTATISLMLKDGRLRKETIGISTGIRLSEVRKLTR